MDTTEKQQLYLKALDLAKSNDPAAFAAFDGLHGYRDSYTFLAYLTMKHVESGTTLEFTAQCLELSKRKGDAKAKMLYAEFLRMVGDEAKARKAEAEAVDGMTVQAAGGDFLAAYLLGQYYSYTGMPEKGFTLALQAADNGFCAAEFLVSQMYAEGRGTLPDDKKAVAYLEKAAYKNYGEAQHALGFRYSKGSSVPRDDEMALRLYQMAAENGISGAAYNLALWQERAYNPDGAFKWLERAALLGNVSAMLKLAMIYDDESKAETHDSASACVWYETAAEKGSIEATFLLGEHYETGEGVTKDMKRAVELYETAAKAEYKPAQSKLGYLYKSDNDIANPQRSLYWNNKAADNGDMRALCNLGLAYEFGNGVEKNEKKAFELYKQSARLGYDRGMYNLAFCYMRGLGTTEDHWQAAQYFEKAAQKGHVEAMYNIGVMYLNGDGVNKDMKRAAEWFYRAAQNNNIESVFYLGYCYLNGYGVKKYPAMAVNYFRKAADGGDTEAMFNLGYCYYNGNGIAEDRETAKKLWRKAAEGGHVYAKEVLSSLGEEE